MKIILSESNTSGNWHTLLPIMKITNHPLHMQTHLKLFATLMSSTSCIQKLKILMKINDWDREGRNCFLPFPTAVPSTDNAALLFCTWMTKRSFLIKQSGQQISLASWWCLIKPLHNDCQGITKSQCGARSYTTLLIYQESCMSAVS